MENTIQPAFAKLNLSLNLSPELTGRGYYRVLFINTQAALHDDVVIVKRPHGIIINDSAVNGRENLALSAAKTMLKRFRVQDGLRIEITKRIPVRAGLGGGSADAAAVINGISDLFGVYMNDDERIALAETLGMDVCYCVVGGLCRIEGAGNRVKRLPVDMPKISTLIAIPSETKSSTAWAYSIIRKDQIGKEQEKIPILLDAIMRGDIPAIARNLHNDFQKPIEHRYPICRFLRETMLEHGALGSMLAGSGLSVFGMFADSITLKNAQRALEQEGIHSIVTHTR